MEDSKYINCLRIANGEHDGQMQVISVQTKPGKMLKALGLWDLETAIREPNDG